MKQPLIGLTPLYDDRMQSYWMVPGYMKGILKAGGTPVILPLIQEKEQVCELMQRLDGLLVTGGPDVNPALYGEEVILESGILAPFRDIMESACLREAVAQDIPALGICRGMQMMNAFMGGSLYQDLETQHPGPTVHSQGEPSYKTTHFVDVVEESPLHRWLGGAAELAVNSFHHQAVKEVAAKLKPMAVSREDGIIEAIWAPEQTFFCGVQWHPERLYARSEQHQATFNAFVEACRR